MSHARLPSDFSNSEKEILLSPKRAAPCDKRAWPDEAQYVCKKERNPFSYEQVCCISTDPRTDVAPTMNVGAAICVRHVSVSGALQFAVFHAVSSVLHRNASQVIHCSELYINHHFFSIILKECKRSWHSNETNPMVTDHGGLPGPSPTAKAVRPSTLTLVRRSIKAIPRSRHFFLRSTVVILPQVHLRKPCYDFYFL